MSPVDEIKIGKTTCQFWPTEVFESQCREWLSGDRLIHVVTLNPEMIMQAETDETFRSAINTAQARVPDGAGLIWARWYVRSQFWTLLPSLLAFPFISAERITGVDLVRTLAKLSKESGHAVYLLGGTREQNSKTREALEKEHPGLKIFSAKPHKHNSEGPEDILNDIAEKKPGVLLVAYGAPKQTVWIEKHKNYLPGVKIAVGVGGAFAILSEDKPRAPKWLRRLNMEWLWRLILEPSRVKRIWQATVRFPLLVNKYKKRSEFSR